MSDASTTFKRFTISAAGTVSDAQDVQGYTLVALAIPASWTTANLTFQGDVDGTGTFKGLTDTDGVAVGWTVGAADVIICPIGADALIGGLVKLKLVSTNPQASERVVIGHFIKTQR